MPGQVYLGCVQFVKQVGWRRGAALQEGSAGGHGAKQTCSFPHCRRPANLRCQVPAPFAHRPCQCVSAPSPPARPAAAQVKKGPLQETSPMLVDISGIPTWSKVRAATCLLVYAAGCGCRRLHAPLDVAWLPVHAILPPCMPVLPCPMPSSALSTSPQAHAHKLSSHPPPTRTHADRPPLHQPH